MLTPFGKKIVFLLLAGVLLGVGLIKFDLSSPNIPIERSLDHNPTIPMDEAEDPEVMVTILGSEWDFKGYQLKSVRSPSSGILFTCLVPNDYDHNLSKIFCTPGDPKFMTNNTRMAVLEAIQQAETKLTHEGKIPDHVVVQR